MTVLARDLQGEGGAEATLQHVVEAARSLAEPCVTAGITLATRRGEVRTSAATDRVPQRGDELQIEHLETGLVNRATIGRATGIVMNGYGMTSSAAFAFLARVSSETNRKLSAIAQEIVEDHDRAQARKSAPRRRMPLPAPGTGSARR